MDIQYTGKLDDQIKLAQENRTDKLVQLHDHDPTLVRAMCGNSCQRRSFSFENWEEPSLIGQTYAVTVIPREDGVITTWSWMRMLSSLFIWTPG